MCMSTEVLGSRCSAEEAPGSPAESEHMEPIAF